MKENYRRFACTGADGAERGLRLLDHQDPRPAAAFETGRGRGLPARQEDRPAGGLPLQGRLALHRRAEAGATTTRSTTGSSSSTSARTPRRRRRRRAGGLLRPAEPGRLPQVPGPCLRARHQLRLRARGGRARHLRLQERQDHPAAAGAARADDASCWPPARPRCWRTSSPTRRGASSRPTWPTTRRKARSSFEFEPRPARPGAKTAGAGRRQGAGREKGHGPQGGVRPIAPPRPIAPSAKCAA